MLQPPTPRYQGRGKDSEETTKPCENRATRWRKRRSLPMFGADNTVPPGNAFTHLPVAISPQLYWTATPTEELVYVVYIYTLWLAPKAAKTAGRDPSWESFGEEQRPLLFSLREVYVSAVTSRATFREMSSARLVYLRGMQRAALATGKG
ncbi:hypothetical protein HPB50_012429 [Hyalomma asiaticum]|uniref:Uncharacterized protein n=1 Tax=Hyalomma asiaticum TaxID=266040 RepID=A0ACB7SVR0_HYAAI|nr:hypothetical protein HPB50_012429 [Hyalomma asiaticum]